jgi:hypothetical protein
MEEEEEIRKGEKRVPPQIHKLNITDRFINDIY